MQFAAGKSNVAFPSTQEGRRTFPLWAAGKSNVPYRCNAGGSPCRAIVCFANADAQCASLQPQSLRASAWRTVCAAAGRWRGSGGGERENASVPTKRQRRSSSAVPLLLPQHGCDRLAWSNAHETPRSTEEAQLPVGRGARGGSANRPNTALHQPTALCASVRNAHSLQRRVFNYCREGLIYSGL